MDLLLSVLATYKPAIDVLVLVFWGIYVYYTIKTFREIKRQTDLQSEAFLVVIGEVSSAQKGRSLITQKVSALYDKWHTILQSNIPTAVQPERYLVLTLKNKGRSDIIWWRIDLNALVSPQRHLEHSVNIVGERCGWSIEHQDNEDIIEPDEMIWVTVGKTGAFPKIDLTWTLEYKDMRGVKYSKFAGDTRLTDTNVLASPSE